MAKKLCGKYLWLAAALCLLPAAGQASGKIIKIGKLEKAVRLLPGDTLEYPPSGYRLKYNGHRVERSECAVPGKNCGFGYFPGERAFPLLEISKDDKCRAAPQPRRCEVTYEVLSGQATGYLDVMLVSVFRACEKEENLDNRNSCYINAVKGGPNLPEYPAYAPENCERIKDSPEHRDACYEAVADKLGDASVCKKMKGAPGFQCVLLQAQAAGDPAVCDTLRRNRFHHTEQDRLDQVASCRNAVRAASRSGR